MSNDQPATPPARGEQPATKEQQVRELLTTAQQQVRAVIKQEVEGEPITKELLNLRLKQHR